MSFCWESLILVQPATLSTWHLNVEIVTGLRNHVKTNVPDLCYLEVVVALSMLVAGSNFPACKNLTALESLCED